MKNEIVVSIFVAIISWLHSMLSRTKQRHNLKKIIWTWQWTVTKWIYGVNKSWCRLGIRWTKSKKVITCLDKIKGWCPHDYYLYYSMEPFQNKLKILEKNSITLKINFYYITFRIYTNHIFYKLLPTFF
jgi:hypothetical protein